MASKRELIQRICRLSRVEKPEFLANFTEKELRDFHRNLKERLKLKKLAVRRSA
jgi:hypothetical protein